MGEIRIFYEVYQKLALYRDFETMPILDRDKFKYKAVKSANKWGGLVIKVKAEVLEEYPLKRRVIEWEIVFIHKMPKPEWTETDNIRPRDLIAKIGKHYRSLYHKRDHQSVMANMKKRSLK